ncbi:MAG: hypothetical protein EVB09_11905 [Verrucomicrobiaceae bacterium]|nr:MAG: hypothetical protein EVB09_11905 [Verrucomicrobiaceae bacterium]
MKQILFFLIASFLTTVSQLFAESPPAVEGHKAFMEGLQEIQADALEFKGAKSASKSRTLSPVVSRFKGWFIDVTEKAKSSKLDEVDVVEGISLASKSRASSAWQFVETEKGYVVRSAGGKYKGWIIVIDDSAKTRPEGPNLTVTPALRLAKSATANSYWKPTLTKQGLVLEAMSGKYKGWVWDFGGGDPSHEESGRQVAVNVLLAEKVVAGSYFAVKAAE